jgi:hypothetical protein
LALPLRAGRSSSACRPGYGRARRAGARLLIDIKRRGLEIAPDIAVGDGALGFWKAIDGNSQGGVHAGAVLGAGLWRWAPYGRVVLSCAIMVKPRLNDEWSASRVIIGAAVFALGLLAGAGIAMWVAPPY